ncbi:MAG: gamma-glutamyl-gamma-aminobutyrate hydrolase family protein [Chloroflexi bacterium]|nr:gamma-glutamyl-gamma-aminobutyrate hydrolase family protein [Chloroflexota bacterium]
MSGPVLLTAPGESPDNFTSAFLTSDSERLCIASDAELPSGAGGLLLCGESTYGAANETPSPALARAIELDIPVLGVGWGMHALNVALGGRRPVRLADAVVAGPRPGRRGRTVELGRMRTFLTLGGKVAATIGAGGPVATPGPGEFAIREAEKAPALMASAYDMETGAIEALEMPGYHWVIGVTWPLHRPELLPAGFDNLIAAFLERSVTV